MPLNFRALYFMQSFLVCSQYVALLMILIAVFDMHRCQTCFMTWLWGLLSMFLRLLAHFSLLLLLFWLIWAKEGWRPVRPGTHTASSAIRSKHSHEGALAHGGAGNQNLAITHVMCWEIDSADIRTVSASSIGAVFYPGLFSLTKE